MNDFPDVEAAVIELLTSFGTCGTVTPADLRAQLPFIRITRIGGADDRITDVARISIDTFDSTRALSYSLGESVRQKLLEFPFVLTNCTIDRVTTNTGPMEIPWGDDLIRRRNASYTVSCRR